MKSSPTRQSFAGAHPPNVRSNEPRRENIMRLCQTLCGHPLGLTCANDYSENGRWFLVLGDDRRNGHRVKLIKVVEDFDHAMNFETPPSR